MKRCELTDTCIFFNGLMTEHRSMAVIYRMRYCRGSHTGCGRHMVYSALGREHVPKDLYPNDRLRALRLIGAPRAPV